MSTKMNRFQQLSFACDVLSQEADALLKLADHLDDRFCDAVELIMHCPGSVIVTGMGKAGLIGQKMVATLASTGTPAHFLHPAEAVHGDLGRIRSNDVVLALSNSGETEELLRLLPSLKQMDVPLIAITGSAQNRLAQAARTVIATGTTSEACSLGLAPSTSTTVMLALGDALALVVSRLKQFAAEDFARLHPAGSLGRKLTTVDEIMRPVMQCRTGHQDQSVRTLLVHAGKPGRRSGAVILTNDQGQLTGIFTDSDLARMLEQQQDFRLDQPIAAVMTKSPKWVRTKSPATLAVDMLVENKISEVPVLDSQDRPIGMIDITDVVGFLPHDAKAIRTEENRTSAQTNRSQAA